MTTPIFAPNAQNYAIREPYITIPEFKAGATGVNTSTLVPQGSSEVNGDALAQILRNASGWADTICNQILACTTEVLSGFFRVYQGQLQIPLPQTPLVAVYGVSVGDSIADLAAVTDLTGLFIDANVITLPSASFSNTDGSTVFAQVTYIAGFANSLIVTAAAAGANTLTLDNTLGMAAGMTFPIYDPGKDEAVTILSITGNTITIVGTTRFAHAAGISLSGLPADVKQAVILLATALTKNRAAQTITIQQTTTTPREKNLNASSGRSEVAQATAMLKNYARVV